MPLKLGQSVQTIIRQCVRLLVSIEIKTFNVVLLLMLLVIFKIYLTVYIYISIKYTHIYSPTTSLMLNIFTYLRIFIIL